MRMGGQNVLPQVGADKKIKKKENVSLSHAGCGPTGYTQNVKIVASNPNIDPVII